MNAFRFGLCFVAALAVAAWPGARANGISSIRNRFRNLVNHDAGYNGGLYEGGAAAVAAAGATAPGGQPAYYQPARQPQYYPPQPVYHQPSPYGHTPRGRYEYPPAPGAYYAPVQQRVPPRYVQRVGPQFVPGSTSSSAALGGGAAASAASAGGGKHGGSTASSAAAGGNHGGAAAAASGAVHSAQAPAGHNSHVVDTEEYNEHYNEPETENTFAAQSGSYANDGKGLETSSYVRQTDSVESHEDGKEDDDHYYNAQSYGKTYDENKHEAYNNDDEDIIHTPTVFRKKKSNTNYVSDFNKARRESGSGVLAHDKHSASYNKNKKKFNESVDKRYRKEGEGLVDSQDFSSASHIDDEDEERTDNHGLGTFVGVDGVHHARRPAFDAHQAAAAQAAASSSAGGGAGHAASTSAAAAGRR